MGTFKQREDYLKQLCIAHPLVAHNSVVDGVTRNSFFRLNNELEIIAATIQTITYPAVGYIQIAGRLTDMDNALVDIRHVFKNAWLFLTHVDNASDTDEGITDRIQVAFDVTFTIMEDFIRMMKDDWELNGHCGAFEAFDLNKINYEQTGPIIQDEYGWILYFEDQIKAWNILSG